MTQQSFDPQAVADAIRKLAPNAQLASDSRRIKLGDVFFAYPGDAGDGRTYIETAIEQGAALVVLDPAGFSWNPDWKAPYLTVENLKQHAGYIAHAFYQ
ncbi:MAG: UDP-N-acetylmuramoyl-L-alanyl-D-glutamate--2,6-diaminopimelate ligase, partial [Paucibacter sp.]|nr:UDP-N-acetylmuramoyl-L-alanyl-D-glutamate--2,6-diaminopimelate ligase [Roseateles sp.]